MVRELLERWAPDIVGTQEDLYAQLNVVNTHFDHEGAVARERSAELLLARVRELDPALPIILLGDFNAAAGASTVYDRLTGDGAFVDSWRAAGRAEPPSEPSTTSVASVPLRPSRGSTGSSLAAR